MGAAVQHLLIISRILGAALQHMQHPTGTALVYVAYLAAITTLAPNSLNFKAIPLPSPVPPPVIKTTRFSNEPLESIVSFLAGNNDACGNSYSPLLADMTEMDLLEA